MPTYEYACEACGHEWEASQSIKDDPLKKCPACKKLKAKRQISAGTGFILKGGGWYSDLYASSSKGGTGDGGDKSKSKSSSKDTASTTSDASSSSKSSDTSKSAGAASTSAGTSKPTATSKD